MMTVQITLPDQLAEEAERAGLLSPERVEKWLSEELKGKRSAELNRAMAPTSTEQSVEELSPEVIADEVRAMRAERRSHPY